jgi:glycosyltransferase involved in cell wall biosynthesis
VPPLVSVLLPTHNRPIWLAEALTSALNGEFRDLEVIVSNNGDPQHTRELACAIRDSRVRWVEQNRDLGMMENFLACLRLARGEYVAVLHDDDRWSQRFLAVLVPPLEHHREAVLSFADHYLVNHRGEADLAATEVNTKRWGRADLREGLHQPFFDLVARQSVAVTGCVFRRSALPISELTPDVGAFYDVWLAYLLATTGGAAYFNSGRLLYYRAHDASYSNRRDIDACLASVHYRRRMLRDPSLRPYRDVLTKRLAEDHLAVGGGLMREGVRGTARVHYATAVRLHPTVRALGRWTASWIVPRSVYSRM